MDTTTRTAQVTRTAPVVRQHSRAAELPYAASVTVTYAASGAVTLELDPSTAAVLLAALRNDTTELDESVRRAAGRDYALSLAAHADRLRTITDAVDEARVALDGPAYTYDVD